jgi:formylglycine-generating enzyme required for sulfatase activity
VGYEQLENKFTVGSGHPGTRRVENIADESAKHLLSLVMSGYNDGAVRTAPVGSYETNPWGLYDISGNVREWTADWYDEKYYSTSPARNPKGPASGEYRVLRGGSWLSGPVNVRSAYRDWLTATRRNDGIGFRCAQDRPN